LGLQPRWKKKKHEFVATQVTRNCQKRKAPGLIFMFKTKRLAHILAIMYALSNDIHKDDTSFNILNWKHMVVKPKWILGNAAPQGCYFLKILVFFA
jgi:hypothetical protein